MCCVLRYTYIEYNNNYSNNNNNNNNNREKKRKKALLWDIQYMLRVNKILYLKIKKNFSVKSFIVNIAV